MSELGNGEVPFKSPLDVTGDPDVGEFGEAFASDEEQDDAITIFGMLTADIIRWKEGTPGTIDTWGELTPKHVLKRFEALKKEMEEKREKDGERRTTVDCTLGQVFSAGRMMIQEREGVEGFIAPFTLTQLRGAGEEIKKARQVQMEQSSAGSAQSQEPPR